MNAITPFAESPRVALFSGNYNYVRDGANQALNRLVEYLERHGVAVRVYSPTAAQPAFAHAGQLVSVPSISIPRRPEYRLALGLPHAIRKDIEAFQPNLFHLSAPDYLGSCALKLAEQQGIPVVASVHTRFETYLRYYGLGWLEPSATGYLRRFYNRCKQIYAPTESMAKVLRAERMSDDIRIWARGVDGNLYNPAKRSADWRASLGIAPDEVVIAFVGRLVLEKGLAVFADTVDAVCARHSKSRVLIVGHGPERECLQRRLPHAVFTGFLQGEDLARAYASSDIFLNPSTTETFGNVTLEALASGIPAVCAKATGSTSLVTHGENGFLSDGGSVEELSGYVGALISNQDMRRAYGFAARRSSQAYDWDHILLQVLLHYRDALALPASVGVSEKNQFARA